MAELRNPYKQGKPVELKHVGCDVDIQDWYYLKQRNPDQGLRDIIISNLWFNFISDLKAQNIPIPTTPDEFTQFKHTLCALVRRRPNPPAA